MKTIKITPYYETNVKIYKNVNTQTYARNKHKSSTHAKDEL